MQDSLAILKALADTVRMRIVHAVLQAEISVAELVQVLGLPQSTVSRHLKPLRDTGLVDTRRDGTSIFYRRGTAFEDAVLARFIEEQIARLPSAVADRDLVRRVLEQRTRKSRDFFDRMAGRYGQLTEPGGGWPALATVMAAGFSGRDVLDLGAGEGDLSLLLARYASRVIAVDHSPEMLRWLNEKAAQAGFARCIETVQADLESLPLADGCVDAVFLSQSLHHVSRPELAIDEAVRVLRPDGLLMILDLIKHDQEWTREQWADQWLGFDPDELAQWLTRAGLKLKHTEKISGAAPDLAVLILVGTKVAA
jgi:ubiquinone/menaquinone biosynthesis C-methylase UbiE/DNA-binding transcriptional regulator YhcF (GntR family)